MTYTPIPGKSHSIGSETEVLAMIRDVLTEEPEKSPDRRTKAPIAAKIQARKEEAVAIEDATAVKAAPAQAASARDVFPDLDDPSKEGLPLFSTRGRAIYRVGAAARFMKERFKIKHAAIAACLLLFYLKPHWIVFGALLSILIFGSLLMLIGMDRIWETVVRWLEVLDDRNPAKAAKWRVRLDRFAERWDRILDIFPDGTVDGLYLPDLQSMQDDKARHAARVEERLSRMATDG